MNESPASDAPLFTAALAMPTSERAAFVARACGDDLAKRKRIEELVRAHDASGEFLEQSLARDVVAAPRSDICEVKPGDLVDRYRLLDKIGEGGCGIVYLAQQEEPVRRQVALKVIKLGMDTRAVIARFEAERQVLAMMDHPNIAHVLDAGATRAGRPYFAMEWVRGIPITDYCDHNHLSTPERLRLFAQVCRAVQHAHQKGIIHRDLKPSNILVTLHDGEPIPKVIDFGIAKATQGHLTHRTQFTAFEQFIGTPAYMSPEQAELSNTDVDTRSDIYSLGVLLYELLTGRAPFEPHTLQAGIDEVRRIIREVDPPLPSIRVNGLSAAERLTIAGRRALAPAQLSTRLRGDLDGIVMKSLEKKRSRRYETVSGLAADIQRHLQNEPVVARPPSAIYRFQKVVSRHKIVVAATAAVLLALIAGFTVSTWQFLKERRARERAVLAEQAASAGRKQAQAALESAELSKRQTEESRQIAEANRRAAEVAQGNAESARHAAELARTEAEDARRIAEEAGKSADASRQSALTAAHDLRAHLYAADMYAAQTQLRDGGDLSQVQRILRSHVPAAGEIDLRGFEWNYAWQQSQGDKAFSWPTQQGIVRDLVFSPDYRYLATAGRGRPGEQGQVRIWDAKTSALLAIFTDTECAGFSSDSRRLLTVTRNGHVHLWNTGTWSATGDFATTLAPLSGNQRVEAVVAPLGSLIAICTDAAYGKRGGSVDVYDYLTGKKVARLENAGCRFVFTPDGSTLVTAGAQDGAIRIWEAATGQLQKQISSPNPSGFITSVAINPHGNLLAILTGGKKGTVRLWDLKSLQPGRLLLSGDQSPSPGSVTFSPDGELVASGGGDRIVRVWKVATGKEIGALKGAAGALWALTFSRDSELLYGGGRGDQIGVWRATKSPHEAERPVTTLAPVRPDVDDVHFAFHPDSHTFAVSDWERLVLCDAHTADVVRKYYGRHRPLGFSTDGKTLLSLNESNRAMQRDDPLTRTLPPSMSSSATTAASASAVALEQVEILDATTLAVKRTFPLKPEGEGVQTATCSSDGSRWALSWRGQANACVFETETGRVVQRFSTRANPVYALAFSPDGRFLAVGGAGIFLEIWDTQSAALVWRIPAHKNSILQIVFSPDGGIVATCSLDRTVKFWDFPGRREISQMVGYEMMREIQFSHDAKSFLALTETGLRSWHVSTQREMGLLPLQHPPTHFVLSPDQRTLVYCDTRHDERQLAIAKIAASNELENQFMEQSPDFTHLLQVRVPGALPTAVEDSFEPETPDVSVP